MFVSPQEDDLAPQPGRVAPSAASGFRDVIGAGFRTEAIETDWHNLTGQRVQDQYRSIYDGLLSAMGPEAFNAELENRGLRTERFPGNRGITTIWAADPRYGQALLDIAQGRLDEGGFGPVPATREVLIEGVLGEIRAEWDDASATLEMGGAGAGLAEFLGRGGAAVSDQVSLMLMPVGAGGGSIARVALTEAALGAAAEAAILPRMYEQAERLDIADPDPLSQIAMGAAFGGALGAAGEGLSRALTYSRIRREIARLPDGVSTVEAQAAVEAAQEALEAGRPVPEFIPEPPAAPQAETVVRDEGPMADFAPRDETDLEGPAPERPMIPTAEEIEAERRRIRSENPQLRTSTPTLNFIRSLGGIQARRWSAEAGGMVETQLAGELRSRGVTRDTVSRLFNNTRGVADIDNIVASEFADGGTPRLRIGDDGTYVDRDALIEAIAQEATQRTPAYRTAEAENAARQLADLEDSFEAIRRDIDAAASAEGVPGMEFSSPFIPRPRDGEDSLTRIQEIERAVDDFASAMDTPPSSEVRYDAMAYLDATGGNVEDALTRAMMDAIERDFDAGSQAPTPRGAEALPAGPEDAGAGRDRTAAENAGIDQGVARSDGPGSSGAAGEQLTAPGIGPVTQRERLEAAQSAPLRGGDALANDGLFDLNARLQRDMFDDPNNAQMQARYDEREAEVREAWNGLEDVEVELEGQTITARQLLDDLEADRAHLQAIETCGWTGRRGDTE